MIFEPDRRSLLTGLAAIADIGAVPAASGAVRHPGTRDMFVATSSDGPAATADFLLACFERPPQGADRQRMLVLNGMTARFRNEGILAGAKPDLLAGFARSRRPLLVSHGRHDRLVGIDDAGR